MQAPSRLSAPSRGTDHLVRLHPDGAVDDTFEPPPLAVTMAGRVELFAAAVQPDGKIVIGGRFSTVGGTACPSVARLNQDGSRDATFSSPFANSGQTVYDLVLQEDGKILLGGTEWYTAGSAGAFYRVARLYPDGAIDTAFTASLAGGTAARVNSVTLTPEGDLLAGGGFDTADGQLRQALARYLLSPVELPDLVKLLRVCAGMPPGQGPGSLPASAVPGSPPGIVDAVYLLQKAAELR